MVYGVIVRWSWGGGWLNDLEPAFHDFAGSGVVHATGADARVDQYYDAATAAAVRRLYADDFALLGYADAPPDATRPRHKVGIWY